MINAINDETFFTKSLRRNMTTLNAKGDAKTRSSNMLEKLETFVTLDLISMRLSQDAFAMI